MKNTLLVFCILANGIAYGQAQKGALLLGPSFNYYQSSNSSKPENVSSVKQESRSGGFDGNLRIGYFVSDKVALGILGGYSSGYSTNEYGNTVADFQSSEVRTHMNSVGLFGRAYKLYNENKFGFFCQLEALYQAGNSTTTEKEPLNGIQQITKSTADVHGFTIGLRPGVVYFITKKIGLESSFGNLSYTNRTQKNSLSSNAPASTTTSDVFNLAFGLNTFYLGINFYLGGK